MTLTVALGLMLLVPTASGADSTSQDQAVGVFATPIESVTTTAQPSFPVRAAFVYPSFPEAWSRSGINPFTHYRPSLGFYDSSSTSAIENQIQAMQYGKIDVGIASWGGQGSGTDARMSTVLATTGASGSGLRWALYYEAEHQGDPTVATLTSDLEYIRDRYGSDPSYYRVGDRFVVFVYGDSADGCAMADRWQQANALVGAYIVLKVFPGYRGCPTKPDGWHQYGPADAEDSQSGYSFTISPGFWKANEASPRLARDMARWNTSVADMVASHAPFQLVTTFNAWGDGTSVESADEWRSSSGYGDFLDALHNDGQPQAAPADTTAPSAPVNLAAGAGDGRVTLSWDASTDDVGVSGYRIYRQNDDGTWPLTSTATTAADAPSFADTGLNNGTSYSYQVTAIDAAGNESTPATASATPQPPADTTPPSAPGNLSATAGDAQVNLTWDASTDDVGVTGYRVYRQNDDGSWPPAATTSSGADTRGFADTRLTNGRGYSYHVTAVDAAGNESTPATASATPQPPADTTAPTPPRLTATAGDTQVALTWNPSTDDRGVTGYRVYRQNEDGSWPASPITTTSPSTRGWADTGLTNGIAYAYRLTAVDAAGNESQPSATASATPQAPPPLLPPPLGDPVIEAAGDISTGSIRAQLGTSDLLLRQGLSGVLTLGDNQYEDGALGDYNAFWDPTWGRVNAIVHPTPGNHEYRTAGAQGYFSYFASKGVEVGTQDAPYYSFDVGTWHFLSLNSEVAHGAGSAQETWVREDLAAHPNQCVAAYWHKPYFGSPAPHGAQQDMQPIVTDLFDANADIVLQGHNHIYERFAPQDVSRQPDSARGIRAWVVGTGGRSHYSFGTVAANSEVRNNTDYGVLKLTLHAGGYDWEFVSSTGSFADSGSDTCH